MNAIAEPVGLRVVSSISARYIINDGDRRIVQTSPNRSFIRKTTIRFAGRNSIHAPAARRLASASETSGTCNNDSSQFLGVVPRKLLSPSLRRDPLPPVAFSLNVVLVVNPRHAGWRESSDRNSPVSVDVLVRNRRSRELADWSDLSSRLRRSFAADALQTVRPPLAPRPALRELLRVHTTGTYGRSSSRFSLMPHRRLTPALERNYCGNRPLDTEGNAPVQARMNSTRSIFS